MLNAGLQAPRGHAPKIQSEARVEVMSQKGRPGESDLREHRVRAAVSVSVCVCERERPARCTAVEKFGLLHSGT